MIYEINDLSYQYPGREKPVFEHVSLTLKEGELLTILGRNGCGKSTLFACMLGLLRGTAGSIRLDGAEIGSLSPKKIAELVGYVPQEHAPAFPYSVFEFVLMGCASGVGLMSHPGKKEEDMAERAIRRMGLSYLKDRPYTELSGGERQQVTIARAIAAEPRVVLFDEPTAHLDFGKQVQAMGIIRELSRSGYSVVVTTHDPNQAFLLGGKTAVFTGTEGVITGDPAELLTEERLKGIYGTELKLKYMEDLGREICMYPKL